MTQSIRFVLALWLFVCLHTLTPPGTNRADAAEAGSLKLLFLGDRGHHQPSIRFRIMKSVMADRGIDLTYTENMADLNPDTLGQYDGLVVYANIDSIADDQADALLNYVASGKGFIPLHCATFCFRNDPEIVDLMGAQFQRHGTGVMTTEPAAVDHPVMRGYETFSSWDETYVHHLHNETNRTELEVVNLMFLSRMWHLSINVTVYLPKQHN